MLNTLRGRFAVSGAIVAIVCVLEGSSDRAQSPPSERKVPFTVGERLTYSVSWSGYLTAGTATLLVKERRRSSGSTSYYIVAEAKPAYLLSKLYTLYYKADVVLNARSLLPQWASVYSQEGSRQRTKVTSFDHLAHKADFEFRTAQTTRQQMSVAPDTQDALSALYVIRTRAGRKVGDRATMPVNTGGKNYRIQMVTGARETVKTGLGTQPAWRISASLLDERNQPSGRPFYVWISDTPAQWPLKLQADLPVGSFVLMLQEVAP